MTKEEIPPVSDTNNVLSAFFTKLVVMDVRTQKEIAVITNDMITTADSAIVVRLTPNYEI